MNKKLQFTAVVFIILFFAGCGEIMNPNSGLNRTATVIEDVAPKVAIVAASTANPIGAMAGTAAAMIAIVAGLYNNYRKKLVISGTNAHLVNTTITTKAIVGAIDKLSNVKIADNKTLGDIVKLEVKEKLRDKEAYKIGKAIIDGLK